MSVREPSWRRSFFPEGHFNCVPPTVVQSRLRQLFSTRGRPKIIRVDNGSPWGSASDLPPELALWLIGLGIEMLWNPPATPQDNGVVERGQGVAKNWAEPHLCESVEHLQRRLTEEDHVQREVYPSIDGKSRLAAYPQLKHSGRVYNRAWERRHWDWQKICDHLCGYVVQRRIDSSGKLGIYHHKLYVGTMHKGLTVNVQFDPLRSEWIVSDERGHQLHRTPAAMLTPVRVQRLQVSSPLH
jgi:hypothetical protein